MIKKIILSSLLLGLIGFSLFFHLTDMKVVKAQSLPFLIGAGSSKNDNSSVTSNNQLTKEKINNRKKNINMKQNPKENKGVSKIEHSSVSAVQKSTPVVHPAAPEVGQKSNVKTNLNVRSSPAMGNNRIGFVKSNDFVTVTEFSKNKFWCKIDFKNHADAWVACKYLGGTKTTVAHPAALQKSTPATHPAAPEVGQKVSVKTNLNVRSSPAMGNNRIGFLKSNTLVTVSELSKNKFWCKIDFKNHANAWVACKYLKESSS